MLAPSKCSKVLLDPLEYVRTAHLYRSFTRFFTKNRRFQGQRPWSPTAVGEIPFLLSNSGFSLFYQASLRFEDATVRLNSVFFILSFCRSVKESIKESAFGRRQEFPAGTVAAPLRQPLKFGTDDRDATATLKMKRSRRLWGE